MGKRHMLVPGNPNTSGLVGSLSKLRGGVNQQQQKSVQISVPNMRLELIDPEIEGCMTYLPTKSARGPSVLLFLYLLQGSRTRSTTGLARW